MSKKQRNNIANNQNNADNPFDFFVAPEEAKKYIPDKSPPEFESMIGEIFRASLTILALIVFILMTVYWSYLVFALFSS